MVAAVTTLKNVSVDVSDLKSAGGAVFPRGQIHCEVVGYLETKARPPYGSSHIGWWPDPILDFLGSADVAAGDVQNFWIRIRAPKDQAPGVFRGTLTVSANGVRPQTFPLTVRVRLIVALQFNADGLRRGADVLEGHALDLKVPLPLGTGVQYFRLRR